MKRQRCRPTKNGNWDSKYNCWKHTKTDWREAEHTIRLLRRSFGMGTPLHQWGSSAPGCLVACFQERKDEAV